MNYVKETDLIAHGDYVKPTLVGSDLRSENHATLVV